MPAIFDFLYREYCRARLAEMRQQLPILPDEAPEANCDVIYLASPAGRNSGFVDDKAATQDDARRIH